MCTGVRASSEVEQTARPWALYADKEVIMVKITFLYADAMSGWMWKKQTCVVSSLQECKRIYGLGVDCDYRIISIEEVK